MAAVSASFAIGVGAATLGVAVPITIFRGLSDSGTTRFRPNMQQAMLNVGTFDDNVVGEDEATFKRPAGDPAIEYLRLRTLVC